MAPIVAALSPLACSWERRRISGPGDTPGSSTAQADARQGRLAARPGSPPAGGEGTAVGLQSLNLATERDGQLYVPSGYRPERRHPLIVALHGAGGDGLGGLSPLRDRADEEGVILLAPDSRARTWDVLLGGYGPDVAFLDRALARTFATYAVDPENVTIEGFSDGASSALGLGLANGDLFQRVIAFSPGFAPSSRRQGRPRVFVSHGVADDVLPIDRCSRRIVPSLRNMDYDVRYREFEGGHAIPPEIVEEALSWWRER